MPQTLFLKPFGELALGEFLWAVAWGEFFNARRPLPLALRHRRADYATKARAAEDMAHAAPSCRPRAPGGACILRKFAGTRATAKALQVGAGARAIAGPSKMTRAGLEPAIPGSVGRCLIHWATGPVARTVVARLLPLYLLNSSATQRLAAARNEEARKGTQQVAMGAKCPHQESNLGCRGRSATS